ncbi:tetratricopeptide repeat protein, partial [Luminiphilus sp.]|nr:tetratricopeptide repeat protein [Luminiphilus sp.]
NTLRELGKLAEAEASCRKAIALKPDLAEAHSNLGFTLQELGRLDEAEASYRQAIALKPDGAKAHSNLGNTLKELGRLDEAEARFRQAIALRPDYAKAHNNLGNTLKELGRLDDAEASYRQAIAFTPNSAQFHYNLGVLFFESRKYDQAAEHFELSDTRLSKHFAIQCSYFQDEASIFYEKYDLLVSQGEVNAVIGSLGIRSAVQYGTKKTNPFCNEPFKYVVHTDLSKQYDFEKIFVQTARNVLADTSVSYKAQGHLTNGVQTAGNIFVQGGVLKTEIENIIRAEIEKYRINFKDSDEGLIKKWPTSYDIQGWLVCMQSGGKLSPHMHASGWITGSIYINVPPKSKADSGNLVLCLGDEDHLLETGNSHQSSVDVVTGTLCLFPSSLHHYTIPFDEKKERVVLAFDVVPKEIPSYSTTQILE